LSKLLSAFETQIFIAVSRSLTAEHCGPEHLLLLMTIGIYTVICEQSVNAGRIPHFSRVIYTRQRHNS